MRDIIKQYDSNITSISELQTRSLNALDESSYRRTQEELDNLTAETRKLGNSLRERIKKMASFPARGREAGIRNSQASGGC